MLAFYHDMIAKFFQAGQLKLPRVESPHAVANQFSCRELSHCCTAPPADTLSCRKCYSICRKRSILLLLFNRTLCRQSEYTMHQLKLKPNTLQVAHQSELVELKKQLSALQHRIKELDQTLAHTNTASLQSKKITIHTERGLIILSKEDILYCQASGNYTYLFAAGERYMVSKTLKSIIDLVDDPNFVRCHQSYYVNLAKAAEVNKNNGLEIILSDGIRIPVSRRNKKTVLAQIMQVR